MTRNGYIKLHRSILDWEWYGDKITTMLFIHLLLTVNINDDVWQGIKIPKGSRVCSLSVLAEETGFEIGQIRGSIKRLEKTESIKRIKYSKFSVVFVTNWNNFQSKKANTQLTQSLTINEHSIEHSNEHSSLHTETPYFSTVGGFERYDINTVANTQLTQNLTGGEHTTQQQNKNKEVKNKRIKNNIYTPKSEISALVCSFSEDKNIQNLLFSWLSICKAKRVPITEDSVSLNLSQLNSLAEKSKLTVEEYLKEIVRRRWATFYEIKPDTKKSAEKEKGDASYDLNEFKERSLHGEIKYERKKKQ